MIYCKYNIQNLTKFVKKTYFGTSFSQSEMKINKLSHFNKVSLMLVGKFSKRFHYIYFSKLDASKEKNIQILVRGVRKNQIFHLRPDSGDHTITLVLTCWKV